MRGHAKPFFEQRRERRGLLRAGLAVAAGSALAGCDALSHNDTVVDVLRSAESLNNAVHRALGRRAMAQEFSLADIAPTFRSNGTSMPPGESYAALLAKGVTPDVDITNVAPLGIKVMFVNDPEGNPIEIVEVTEG